jgi:hypothetical protein
MKDRSNLSWTRGAKGFALHVGKSRKPLLHVLPDNRWPNMRRIRYRGTSASDLLNPTRAKDTDPMQARGAEVLSGRYQPHHQRIGDSDGSPDSKQPAARRTP